MTPINFLRFRDALNPASGFQSMQFREIEFASGLKDEIILRGFREDEFATKRLTARFHDASLSDAFIAICADADLTRPPQTPRSMKKPAANFTSVECAPCSKSSRTLKIAMKSFS
jgi:tryptophan 2,3-dioxygenase